MPRCAFALSHGITRRHSPCWFRRGHAAALEQLILGGGESAPRAQLDRRWRWRRSPRGPAFAISAYRAVCSRCHERAAQNADCTAIRCRCPGFRGINGFLPAERVPSIYSTFPSSAPASSSARQGDELTATAATPQEPYYCERRKPTTRLGIFDSGQQENQPAFEGTGKWNMLTIMQLWAMTT